MSLGIKDTALPQLPLWQREKVCIHALRFSFVRVCVLSPYDVVSHQHGERDQQAVLMPSHIFRDNVVLLVNTGEVGQKYIASLLHSEH